MKLTTKLTNNFIYISMDFCRSCGKKEPTGTAIGIVMPGKKIYVEYGAKDYKEKLV